MNAKNIDEYQAVSIFLNYQFFLAEKQIVLVLKLLIIETAPIAHYKKNCNFSDRSDNIPHLINMKVNFFLKVLVLPKILNQKLKWQMYKKVVQLASSIVEIYIYTYS